MDQPTAQEIETREKEALADKTHFEEVKPGEDKRDLNKELVFGAPVWLRIPGLPHLAVQAGVVDYQDLRNPSKGIMITSEGVVPKPSGQPKFIYVHVESGDLWPRRIRMPAP